MYHLHRLRGSALAIFGRPATKLALARELVTQGAHRVALPLFVKLAKAGLPAASYELGRTYLLGHGVPCCLNEALRWLNQAAAAGEVAAQTLLADLALQGFYQTASTGLFDTVTDDRAPNYELALKWAGRAVACGSSEAKVLLGFILTAGPVQVRDQEQGERLYRQAAEAGNAQGQFRWALVLLRRNNAAAVSEARGLLEAAASTGVPSAHYLLGIIAEGDQDFPAAAEHYRVGAELGLHPAELRYGVVLLIGRGVKEDAINGESWLRRAGLAGEAQAAAIVGDLYASSGPLPPNYFEAAIWFRRAAEAGHSGAARALGQLHLRGAGVTRDPQEAALWFRQAAAQDDDGAMADLAQLALTRQVPESDRQATFAWFLQKAGAGDPAAAFNVGICLAEGIGTRRDDALALLLFRHAAKCMPIAQYWCGRMLAEGRGCAPDLQAARAWFLQAAEKGNTDAEVAAGEMLFNGRGGPPDRGMAAALFMRAAATGHSGASFALEVLRRSELSDASGSVHLAA
jgi:TPR repeat protein